MKYRAPMDFSGRLRSVQCAVKGIGLVISSQPNARIHLFATGFVLAAGLHYGLTAAEWCWIVLTIAAVWTAETLNTALEFLTDVASPAFHPLAEKAKDTSAGAVLITAAGAVVVGLLVFVPHISERIE